MGNRFLLVITVQNMFPPLITVGKNNGTSFFLKKSGTSKSPVDTGRKLNVHKTFRRRPGRFLNVLFIFNLRLVSTGISSMDHRIFPVKRQFEIC